MSNRCQESMVLILLRCKEGIVLILLRCQDDLAGGDGERREGITGSTSTAAAAEQMQEGQDDGGSCAGKFISDIITTNILQRLLCV